MRRFPPAPSPEDHRIGFCNTRSAVWERLGPEAMNPVRASGHSGGQESGDITLKALIKRGNNSDAGFRLMNHFDQNLPRLLGSSYFAWKVDARALHPLRRM
jgi:hypothetical protein